MAAQIYFINSQGKHVSSYLLNSEAYVEVYDNDSAANNPQVIDHVSVEISDPLSGDKETVSLIETGNNTGVFRNMTNPIIIVNTTSVNNDGKITTKAGDYIKATYTDKLDGDNDSSNNEKSTQALVIGYKDKSIHFVDAEGNEVKEYHIGDKIYVLLVSSNSSAPEISELRESYQLNDEIRISWITDTDATGYVRYSANSDLSNYTTAYDVRGQSYTGQTHYVDITDLGDSTTYYYEVISSTSQRTTVDDNNGNYYNFTTLPHPNNYDTNYKLAAVVNQSDGSTPAEGVIIYVTVTTTSNETSYPLSALTNDKGRWSVDLDSLRSTSTGQFLKVQNGDTIHIEAEGANMGTATNDSAAQVPPATQAVYYCANLTLGAPYHTHPPAPGANQDPNVAENVTVDVRDPLSGDWEALVLNETGPNTSMFMNTWQVLSSANSSVTTNNSVLETGDGHVIEVNYYDLNATATMLQSSKGIAQFVDASGNPVNKYVVGDGVYVKVTDPNANIDTTSVDTINVTVKNPSTGDTENLTLNETGIDTGIFMNLASPLLLTSSASSTGDGKIQGSNGDFINVTYVDENPAGYEAYAEAQVTDVILSINKTANETQLSPGDIFHYTIVVHNSGLDTATNIEIRDPLPANITYLNDTANASTFYHSGRTYVWNFTSLAPGETIQFVINVKVNDTAGPGNITNNATMEHADSAGHARPAQNSEATVMVPEFPNIGLAVLMVLGVAILIIRRMRKREEEGGDSRE